MQEYYVGGKNCNINMLCLYLYKYAHYGFIYLIYYYELIANELFEVVSIRTFCLDIMLLVCKLKNFSLWWKQSQSGQIVPFVSKTPEKSPSVKTAQTLG